MVAHPDFRGRGRKIREIRKKFANCPTPCAQPKAAAERQPTPAGWMMAIRSRRHRREW
jgi:hypothetical protein